MKKNKKRAGVRVPEIVSLNEELFSLVSGDPMAALDQRLAAALGASGNFICDTFTCGRFSGSCSVFGCTTFKIN